MISERTRLQYLKRMGIASYVPTRQLAGARPSIRLIATGQRGESAAQVAHGKPASLQSVRELLSKTVPKEAAPQPVTATPGSETPQPHDRSLKATPPRGDLAKSSERKQVVTNSEDTGTKPADVYDDTPMHLSVFQYQALAVLVELPHQAGIYALDNTHRILIADAIRLATGTFDGALLTERELHWPLTGAKAMGLAGSAYDLLSGYLDMQEPELIIAMGKLPESEDVQLTIKRVVGPSVQQLVNDAASRTQFADELITLRNSL
jgi:hypothetical protein